MAARPHSIATTRATSGRGAPSHTNTARPTKTERSAADQRRIEVVEIQLVRRFAGAVLREPH